MNVIDQARMAYGSAAAPTRTPRSAEHQVLSEVTARLAAAAKAPRSFPRLVAALHDNRRLWNRLAADVADPENGLPVQLRAQIFYLAEFTDTHSSQCLSGEAEPGVLVDINTAVMRGLSGVPVAEAS